MAYVVPVFADIWRASDGRDGLLHDHYVEP